jgi:hypothetical protein
MFFHVSGRENQLFTVQNFIWGNPKFSKKSNPTRAEIAVLAKFGKAFNNFNYLKLCQVPKSSKIHESCFKLIN